MKKTLFVLLALALVSSFAFAELTGGGADSATMTGYVSLTGGYDLDNEGFGFVNDSDVTVTLPLLSGSGGASGDDGIYAEIGVDVGWNLQNGGFEDTVDGDDGYAATDLTADISATIYFNDFYLVLDNPDFEIQNVDIAANDAPGTDYVVDAYADASDATGGFTLGFKNDMMDVAFMVASENDYRGDADDIVDNNIDIDDAVPFTNGSLDDDDAENYTANSDGNLVFGVSATINAAEGITVPVKFLYDAKSGSYSEDLVAFGMAPSVAMDALTFDLPVDYVSYGDMSGLEMKPALGYEVMDNFKVSTSLLYGTYTDVVVSGVSIENPVAALTVGVADTGAFVEGLSWNVDVTLDDFMNYRDVTTPDGYLPLTVDASASFSQNGMKPYMNMDYDFTDATMSFGLGVELGADFTGIDNAVVTIYYYNDQIVDGSAYDADGLIPAESDGDTLSGRITVDVTVSF